MRLTVEFGLKARDGMVRISMAHDDLMEEINRLMGVLEAVL